ncbi:uncharacterized protein A4U43_C05F9500 [Asparagus officinalis]|uniref:Uncharacterized protein n=1 Tax=Asparagus officinalis TaxID=4686 RepID=A0A5P1EVW5_ASPOF|nr:uncharacterized protein A4U43_C05F9500 [Asparagus officinalis]
MEKEKNNVEKERKMERCCEEGIQSCGSDDWTRQQEASLQRAYLAAKPSPHFWKKVAKMDGDGSMEVTGDIEVLLKSQVVQEKLSGEGKCIVPKEIVKLIIFQGDFNAEKIPIY